MTSPTWFFDGVRRRIYEVPPGASFTTDGDGYRIYDGGPSSPDVMTVDVKKDNWSRWTDWHALNDWALLAFAVSGGGQRPTGEYSSADFTLLTADGWRYVLANYPHETIFYGNLFAQGSDSLFDFARLTVNGVVPRMQGSANMLTYSYATSGADATAVANAVWAHATGIAMADRMAVAAAILRNKTITDPVSGMMTVYADDGITPLFAAQLYENAAGTQVYRGQGSERRERLT